MLGGAGWDGRWERTCCRVGPCLHAMSRTEGARRRRAALVWRWPPWCLVAGVWGGLRRRPLALWGSSISSGAHCDHDIAQGFSRATGQLSTFNCVCSIAGSDRLTGASHLSAGLDSTWESLDGMVTPADLADLAVRAAHVSVRSQLCAA
eukprot:COSAG01_NODE_29945_length_626_cov_1.455408_1_plen_148_part_01